MKKLILFFTILLLCNIVKSQETRWMLLDNDTSKKEEIFIDKEMTITPKFFDARFKVVVIWVKILSMPTQKGEYVKEEDEKIAVAVEDNQFELKGHREKYNGKIIDDKQFDEIAWKDIYPETVGESLLIFCKKYLSSKSSEK